MRPSHSMFGRLRRSLWGTVAFLCGFTVLIVFVANYFMLPAMSAAVNADTPGRRQLSAVSALLLAILLMMLIIGLLLTFRVHRFFFPRPSRTKVETKYVDAWAEAGRRAGKEPPS